MVARFKLQEARELLLKELLPFMQHEMLDDERPLLKITFISGVELYIRYNDHDEYSYQIIFSQESLDRIRFDNYDDRWNVNTRPHHFHPRGEEKAIESPMIGDPFHDIPILIKYIQIKS